MNEILWRSERRGNQYSALTDAVIDKLISKVADSDAGRLFPPVAKQLAVGVVTHDRHLGGAQDAAALADALRDKAFAPLRGALRELDRWCADTAMSFSDIIAGELLDPANPALFAPLVSELFSVCAANRMADIPAFARRRCDDYQALLTEFLARLRHDRPHWHQDRYQTTVTRVSVNGSESHNGGHRVLRVDFAGGASLAYKPRPANGERLFLARGVQNSDRPASVFELLNGLEPAADPVELPTMDYWDGAAAGYSWQEWLLPGPDSAIVRPESDLRVTRVSEADAARFWRRAGNLTAACAAFGIGDLVEGNLLAGATAADPMPHFHPVDIEAYFAAIGRLTDTGIVDGETALTHHIGLPNRVRWCSTDAPSTCFLPQPDGGLHLVHRNDSWAAAESSNLVTDDAGRLGYGHYLPEFLRGAFDAWTLICANVEPIREFIAIESPQWPIRVLPRPTADYATALEAWLLHGVEPTHLSPNERTQLARGDVPYFFTRPGTNQVLALDADNELAEIVVTDAVVAEAPLPSESVRAGEHWDMTELGVTLRDAVSHALGGTDSVSTGDSHHTTVVVEETHGLVGLDWEQMDWRLVYQWDDDTVRLRVNDIDADPDWDAIALRLARIDSLDAELREPLAQEGFADAEATATLERQTNEALLWLETVVDVHGWPTQSLVGAPSAAAAARLLQHVTGHDRFRDRCLKLMSQAADHGDVDGVDLAYTTDALLVSRGQPQRYGTKFRKRDGRLEPFPVADMDSVDEDRATVGLPPMAVYAQYLADRYGSPTKKEATR